VLFASFLEKYGLDETHSYAKIEADKYEIQEEE